MLTTCVCDSISKDGAFATNSKQFSMAFGFPTHRFRNSTNAMLSTDDVPPVHELRPLWRTLTGCRTITRTKFLAGTAKPVAKQQVQRLMELTWGHDDAVRSERTVEDICRFPAALQAIIAANGAKVEHAISTIVRDGASRSGHVRTGARIEAVEELLQARFERLDPTPMAPDPLPPKKRHRE